MTTWVINEVRQNGAFASEANYTVIVTSSAVFTADAWGVWCTGDTATILVQGSLTTSMQAAQITTNNGSVVVSESGVISSLANGYGAIAMDGSHSSVVNAGLAWGRGYGIYMDTGPASTSTSSRIVNSGSLFSEDYGVYALGVEDLVIKNTGLISGGKASFFEFADGGRQKITNSGEMIGHVLLGRVDEFRDL